jgi:hypothetical protein
MKAGMTPALVHRLRRADVGARQIVIANTVTREDVRRTRGDWEQLDGWPVSGLEVLPDHRLGLSTGLATAIEQTSSDDHITDLDGPPNALAAIPFLVAKVTWAGTDSPGMAIHRVVARLHPKLTAEDKEVARFRCQLFAVERMVLDEELELRALSLPATVDVPDATELEQDFTFDFTDLLPRPKALGPPIGGGPFGVTAPVMYAFLWATKTDGSPASNVGWARDTGTANVTTASNVLEGAQLQIIAGPTPRYEEVLYGDGCPRVRFETASYTEVTAAYTTAPIDLTAAATVLGADAFDALDDTDPAAHTPTSGLGGWSVLLQNDGDPLYLAMSGNRLRYFGSSAGGEEERFVLISDNPVMPTTGIFETWVTWQRDDEAIGVHYGGLSFYLDEAGTFTFDGDATGLLNWPPGVHVRLSESGLDNVRFQFAEFNAAGTQVQNTSDTTDIPLGGTDAIRLGCTLDIGTRALTIWTEPDGGGVRTVHGTETLLTDFVALGYGRVGVNGTIFSAGNVEMFWDDFRCVVYAALVDDVEIIVKIQTPLGTAVTAEINDGVGSGWVPVRHRDRVGVDLTPFGGSDLTGVAKQLRYLMRSTLTPNAAGDVTPYLIELGAREVRSIDLDGLARVSGGAWNVAPDTLQAETSEAVITVIQDGVRDFTDAASVLASATAPVTREFEVYWGHPALPRADWLHAQTYEVEDQQDAGGAVDFLCVTKRQHLYRELPAPVDAGGGQVERDPIIYDGVSLKSAWDDALTNRLAIQARDLGPGIDDDTTAIRNILTAAKGEDVIGALARLGGGAADSVQGRLRFIDFHGVRVVAAVFPSEEIEPLFVGPGLRGRIPAFNVPFDWNDDEERFLQEAQHVHVPSLNAFGPAPFDVAPTLADHIARWIPDDPDFAKTVAKRVVDPMAGGRIELQWRSTYAYPELTAADVVLVQTDRFVAFNPVNAAPITGMAWVVCILIGGREGEPYAAREFSGWVTDYADIFSSGEDIIQVLPAPPTNVTAWRRFYLADAAIDTKPERLELDFIESVSPNITRYEVQVRRGASATWHALPDPSPIGGFGTWRTVDSEPIVSGTTGWAVRVRAWNTAQLVSPWVTETTIVGDPLPGPIDIEVSQVLQIAHAFAPNARIMTTSGNVLATDYLVVVDISGGGSSTLPASGDQSPGGRQLVILNASGDAHTVNPDGSDTINGGASLSIPAGAIRNLILPGSATNWRAA